MSKATTAATKEQLVELMQYLSQNISVPTIGIGGGFAPIGTIISYMGTTAPQDYLICDGTTYNIADYKQLSDFFAAQFGSANFFGGDGVTTFKVPDLRGEFLRGTGTNSHANQGNGQNVGVHQDGTEHPAYTLATDNVWYLPNKVNNSSPKKADSSVNTDGGRKYANLTETVQNDEMTESFTSRPTNTSVLYCIKAVAAGDVYSTTERVVGTWIDGKPVYEKTITSITMPQVLIDDTSVVGDNYFADLGINNVDNIVDYMFILRTLRNTYIKDKQISSENDKTILNFSTWVSYTQENGYIFKIRNAKTSNNDATTKFTIRYTKTTD